MSADKRQATAAFRWANTVRTAARALLNLHPRCGRRKRAPRGRCQGRSSVETWENQV